LITVSNRRGLISPAGILRNGVVSGAKESNLLEEVEFVKSSNYVAKDK